jgi:hypothetical protein
MPRDRLRVSTAGVLDVCLVTACRLTYGLAVSLSMNCLDSSVPIIEHGDEDDEVPGLTHSSRAIE